MENQITYKLLEALQKGNHKAFETIFLKYFPKVKYYINGFVKSVDVAEELTQNVFVKVWENHDSFTITSKGIKGFDSYIYTRLPIDKRSITSEVNRFANHFIMNE